MHYLNCKTTFIKQIINQVGKGRISAGQFFVLNLFVFQSSNSLRDITVDRK